MLASWHLCGEEDENEPTIPTVSPYHSLVSIVAYLNVVSKAFHQPLGCQQLGPGNFVIQGRRLPRNGF